MIKEIGDFIKSLSMSIVAALFITLFLFEGTTVSGSSMFPTLHGADEANKQDRVIADRLFVYKLPFALNKEPEYGDIVVIDSRVDEDHTLKEEIMDNALVNLAIEMKNKSMDLLKNDNTYKQDNEENRKERYGHLWVKRVIGKERDTLEFKENQIYRNGILLEESYTHEEAFYVNQTITVPENHVFVLGDNRNHSLDSRVIGSVPVTHIKGKAVIRIFPFTELKSF